MKNTYYVINQTQLDLCDCKEVVEDKENINPLPDGTYIIKIKLGTEDCVHLEGIQEYTHSEILAHLASFPTEE